MSSILVLTAEKQPDFDKDDLPFIEILKQKGHKVDPLPWSQAGDQVDNFDLCLVRNTWDYHFRLQEFKAALQKMSQSSTPLFNSYSLIDWNSDKYYLTDLSDNDIPVVHTRFVEASHFHHLQDALQDYPEEEFVLKPRVSAGAHLTYLINKNDIVSIRKLEKDMPLIKNQKMMLQRFVSSVVSEGEYSFMYFNGEFSHAVNKKPKSLDFRVQEEFGGQNELITPDPVDLAGANAAIKTLPEVPLYARVDMVRDIDGQLFVMELELIEPSLYLSLSKTAPALFAEAILSKI